MSTPSDPQALGFSPPPLWQQPVVVAVRVFIAVILAWILLLVQRTPADAFIGAFEVSATEREKLLSLQESVRSLRTGGAPAAAAIERVHEGLSTLRLAPLCPPALAPAIERPLARMAKAVDDLGAQGAQAGTMRRMELANSLHAELAELDRLVDTCLRSDVERIRGEVASLRVQIYAMAFLLALSAIGVLWLRNRDRRVLRRQLLFSQQLIDAVPLPLSLRTPAGEFLLVNRAFEEKHGVSRTTVTGRAASEALPREAAERIGSMDARALASDAAVEDIFEIDDAMGLRHVQVRVQALRQPDTGITGVIGVQSDVTALRLKEAELLRANERLSQLAARMLDAQEGERQRIARDLHDQVGQILTALKLQLGSLARRPAIAQPQAALVAPIDLAEEALRHTRDLSASLHPHLLDDLGLRAAVGSLIERFIRPSLPQVDLRCELSPLRGPQASELVAFRVVQEALTNVIRHAKATRAGVILDASGTSLSLEVIDDGIGFEPAGGAPDLQRVTSVGLASMRDRVRDLGGTLQVESRPGTGTSVRARLPWGPRPGT